jgi:hypothetical protein
VPADANDGMPIALCEARRSPVSIRISAPFAEAKATTFHFATGCRDKRGEFAARYGKPPDRERPGDGYKNSVLSLGGHLLVGARPHREACCRHCHHLGTVGTILERFACARPNAALLSGPDFNRDTLTGLCPRGVCEGANDRQRDGQCTPTRVNHDKPQTCARRQARLTPPACSPPA